MRKEQLLIWLNNRDRRRKILKLKDTIMNNLENQIQEWIKETLVKNVNNYMLVVCDTVNDECFPVYCKTFDELHSNYHKYHNVNDQRVEEVIRIENDGTVDRNLEIHNLL